MKTITFNLNLEDLDVFRMHLYLRNREYGRKPAPVIPVRSRIFYPLLLVFTAAELLYAELHPKLFGKPALIVGVVFVTFLLLASIAVWTNPFLPRFSQMVSRSIIARYKMRERDVFEYLGEYALTLTPEAIRESWAVGELTVKWCGIHEIEATKEHIYIYTAPMSAIIVPQRAFPTEAESEAFLSTADEYYEAAKSNASQETRSTELVVK